MLINMRLLTVFLKSEKLTDVGFVKDYRDMDSMKNYVDEVLDHKNLNDLFHFNTTVENLFKHIYLLFTVEFPEMYAIELSETPKTNCRYEPK